MSEWISVKDRLPEQFIDVLVWCVSSVVFPIPEGTSYAGVDSFVLWNDGVESSFRTDRFNYGKVTHWCAIPAPPKENCTE